MVNKPSIRPYLWALEKCGVLQAGGGCKQESNGKELYSSCKTQGTGTSVSTTRMDSDEVSGFLLVKKHGGMMSF